MPRLSNIWTNPTIRVVSDVPLGGDGDDNAPHGLREARLAVTGLLCSL